MPKAQPLLLDLFPNASVAYSLRKLRTAYSGSAIRVRRSSDNAEQDIGFVDNELDTTSMLDFVGYNLLTFSEDLSSSIWLKTNLNTTGTPSYIDVETAPDGSLTGDKIIESTVNSTHYTNRQTISLTISNDYNISVYLKQAERNKVQIRSSISGSVQTCDLDLTNGAISNNGFVNTPVVTAEANGWYRFSVTITSGTSSAIPPLFVFLSNGTSLNYAGNNISGVYIWGAQLSQTSTVKPYQKTVTDAARNAFITTWYDQSTNGNNASIPTASLQAQIVTSGLIETDPFTGKISTLWTGDYYNFTVLSLTQNYLTTAVYSRTLTNDQMLTIGEGTSGLRLYQWLSNGNTVSEITVGNLITHQTGVTTTGAYILTSLRDNSNVVKAFRNTTALSTGTDSGVNISLRAWGRLGSFITRGRMVEMVLFLNDKESSRADIVTNQNDYWNVY
jgi:hypothetical protein